MSAGKLMLGLRKKGHAFQQKGEEKQNGECPNGEEDLSGSRNGRSGYLEKESGIKSTGAVRVSLRRSSRIPVWTNARGRRPWPAQGKGKGDGPREPSKPQAGKHQSKSMPLAHAKMYAEKGACTGGLWWTRETDLLKVASETTTGKRGNVSS